VKATGGKQYTTKDLLVELHVEIRTEAVEERDANVINHAQNGGHMKVLASPTADVVFRIHADHLQSDQEANKGGDKTKWQKKKKNEGKKQRKEQTKDNTHTSLRD
jgi:hypothetical protein